MKLHFGHWLVAVAIVFMGFIVYLVSQMMGQKVDLVEKNYYEKGLDYQEVINEKKNERNSFEFKQEGDLLQLKNAEAASVKQAVLELYRPSDSGQDTIIPVKISETGMISIDGQNWLKGNWQYTLHFEMESVWYYQKGDLYWQ